MAERRRVEHAQQLHLRGEADLADLVEEDRAAVRHLEEPGLGAVGAGERAALVAEQLALQQALLQRRALDDHERLVAPRAARVQQLRDHLLAGARLAGDEHGRVARRHALDELQQLAELRALRRRTSCSTSGGVSPRSSRRRAPLQRLALERPLDADLELVERTRLDDVVEGTAADRLDRRVDRAVAGEHDDLAGRAALADAPGAPRGRSCRAAAGRAARRRAAARRRGVRRPRRSRPRRPRSRAARARRPAPGETPRRRRRAGRDRRCASRRRPPSSAPPRRAGSTTSNVDPAPGALVDHDVAAPAADEVQRQEEAESGAALPQAEERLEDPLLVLGRRCRSRRRSTRMRSGSPASTRQPSPCRPAAHACTALSSRLMRACCSSASSARTRRPGHDRLDVDGHAVRPRRRLDQARDRGDRLPTRRRRRRATAARATCRRKCCVMPRQRSTCSRAIAALSRDARPVRARRPRAAPRAGCPRRTSARSPAACSARARSPRPAARATRAGATRPAAPRPRAAPRCRARPRRRARRAPDRVANRRGVHLLPRDARRPACGRSQMRTWRSPDARQAERRAVRGRAHARRHVAAAAAEHLVAAVAGPLQEGIVGRDHRPLRVEHDDAVVDAVDDGLEPLALLAHLADQAGHRVGHRVELAREPRDRVAAVRRHAAARGRRRRSAAPSSRTAAAGAARRRGRRSAIAADQEQRERAAADHHPAQVAVHRRTDLAGVRCRGSGCR